MFNKQRRIQQLFFDPEIEKKKIKNFKNCLDRMRQMTIIILNDVHIEVIE